MPRAHSRLGEAPKQPDSPDIAFCTWMYYLS
jgi:hypothetical protein